MPGSLACGPGSEGPVRSRPMREILEAIQSGASGDDLANLPIPESYRAAHVLRSESRHVGRGRVRRQGPPQVAPRRRGPHTRAGPRRGVPRGHGVGHQLQHGVDLDLRAAAHVRVPRPPRQGERLGRPPRPGLPRRRLRRLGRGAARRLRGAQLEAGRQGHRPLQPRRRPVPDRPRRLDARRQPAHLGFRDQLRRARRPLDRQGQPAHAQARPPDVGRGGVQRAVQLDELPHDRRPSTPAT